MNAIYGNHSIYNGGGGFDIIYFEVHSSKLGSICLLAPRFLMFES